MMDCQHRQILVWLGGERLPVNCHATWELKVAARNESWVGCPKDGCGARLRQPNSQLQFAVWALPTGCCSRINATESRTARNNQAQSLQSCCDSNASRALVQFHCDTNQMQVHPGFRWSGCGSSPTHLQPKSLIPSHWMHWSQDPDSRTSNPPKLQGRRWTDCFSAPTSPELPFVLIALEFLHSTCCSSAPRKASSQVALVLGECPRSADCRKGPKMSTLATGPTPQEFFLANCCGQDPSQIIQASVQKMAESPQGSCCHSNKDIATFRALQVQLEVLLPSHCGKDARRTIVAVDPSLWVSFLKVYLLPSPNVAFSNWPVWESCRSTGSKTNLTLPTREALRHMKESGLEIDSHQGRDLPEKPFGTSLKEFPLWIDFGISGEVSYAASVPALMASLRKIGSYLKTGSSGTDIATMIMVSLLSACFHWGEVQSNSANFRILPE